MRTPHIYTMLFYHVKLDEAKKTGSRTERTLELLSLEFSNVQDVFLLLFNQNYQV